jgi:16S rRNA (guanine527-N7)-methyltransferase
MNSVFDDLYEIYEEYNSHTNISSIREKADVYEKHFEDSISVLDFYAISGKLIDIGTGGGFPSLPLAITRPDLEITAIDSVNKKIIFVNQAKDKLQLNNLIALNARAEELAHDPNFREEFDWSVSRAVAELSILLELASGFLKPGGKFIAYKKLANDDELRAAKSAATKTKLKLIEAKPYGKDKQFLLYEKIARCPSSMPRKYQQIKKNPL